MVKIVIDPSCLNQGGSTYDDTEVLNRIKALEGKTDNFVSDVTVSREGNKVKLKYTRVDGTSSEVEFDDKDTISMAYDDTAIKERVKALEAKEDKDTVYDDSALKARVEALEAKPEVQPYNDKPLSDRVTALENKPDKDTIYDDSDLKEQVNDLGSSVASALHDISEIRVDNESRLSALEKKEDNDKQTLSLDGSTLSISGGNSVTLPVGVGKEFVVTSDTEGVVVTKTEADATTTYNVNLDNALNKYYKKAETYTKKEVDNLLTNQENKATDLTVYRGSFTDRSKVMEGEHDAPISPRVTLTYSSSTGIGIFKIDFKVTSKVNWRDVIATLPPEAPVPVELVESQVWIGNNNTSVWIDKGSRNVQIFGVSNPEMFNKRIILSIPGIFKKA